MVRRIADNQKPVMTSFALGTPLPFPSIDVTSRDRMAVRRSAPAQTLTTPGPSDTEIADILTLAARTPDHGKLFPWRFVVMGPDSRKVIAEALRPLAAHQPDPKKAAAVLGKLTHPPLSILVISTPVTDHAVPVWEQELSAGAVCMNLEHAADTFGYATSWITDWYSYHPDAASLFGVKSGERIAGFIHIGTRTEPPLERVRPDLTTRTTYLG